MQAAAVQEGAVQEGAAAGLGEVMLSLGAEAEPSSPLKRDSPPVAAGRTQESSSPGSSPNSAGSAASRTRGGEGQGEAAGETPRGNATPRRSFGARALARLARAVPRPRSSRSREP